MVVLYLIIAGWTGRFDGLGGCKNNYGSGYCLLSGLRGPG
jgi:hypothetical protein